MQTDITRLPPDQIWRQACAAAGHRPTVLSPLTLRKSAPRAAIYARLLTDPPRPWTVNDVLGVAIAGPRPGSGAIRSAIYVLLGDGVLTRVPYQRALTARLTLPGVTLLRALLWQWGLAELRLHTPAEPTQDRSQENPGR